MPRHRTILKKKAVSIPMQQLYEEAKVAFNKKSFSEDSKGFQLLNTQYPDNPYFEASAVYIFRCKLETIGKEQALRELAAFVKSHPRGKSFAKSVTLWEEEQTFIKRKVFSVVRKLKKREQEKKRSFYGQYGAEFRALYYFFSDTAQHIRMQNLYKEGEKAMRQENWHEVIEKMQRLNDKYPDNPYVAQAELAIILGYVKQKEIEKAKVALKFFAKEYPKVFESFLQALRDATEEKNLHLEIRTLIEEH